MRRDTSTCSVLPLGGMLLVLLATIGCHVPADDGTQDPARPVLEPIFIDLDTPGSVLNEAQFAAWPSQVRKDSHYVIRWEWDRTRPQWILYRDVELPEPTTMRVIAIIRCEREPAHRNNHLLRRLKVQDLKVQVNPDLGLLPMQPAGEGRLTVSQHFYPYELDRVRLPAGCSRVALTVGAMPERRMYFAVDGLVLVPEGVEFGVDDYLRHRKWK